MIPERYRPIGYLTELTRRRTGGRVLQGPFHGMRYVRHAVGSAYIPKLLGTYERELGPYVEAICSSGPRLVVDLGSAEGYYAVGLARRMPDARVVCFEKNPQGRCALAEMSDLNGVGDRIAIRETCGPADLEAVLATDKNAVVICDVEGDEDALLDPGVVPALTGATILVELHDFLVPGIGRKLGDRFSASHAIEEIVQTDRDTSEFPWRTLATLLLPGSYLRWAVSEWRPARMSWLWMVPKC